MSKGIKKVANVVIRSLFGVVLVLFLLILVVGFAFSLPRVQSFAAAKAVEWVSDRVGVGLSIDALYISGLSHLAVDDD